MERTLWWMGDLVVSKAMREKKIYIIGGGPAGMATAYYLAKRGIKSIVYELRENLGGMSRSWIWNDFIVDTGPHILHTPDKEIWNEWQSLIGESLESGSYYSANYKKDGEGFKLFDYPLNLNQILNSNYWDLDTLNTIKKEIKETPNFKKTSNADSFKSYIDGLIGKTLSKEFFYDYPKKVWSISPDDMLPDWAPKRIRRCSNRETFFNDQFCGISTKGSGYIFEKICSYLEERGSSVFKKTKVQNIKTEDKKLTHIITNRKEIIEINEEDIVVSTIPITILSEILGKKFSLDFRGIASTYISFENTNQILPNPFHWLYFADKKTIFNRITEPTKLSRKLNLGDISRTYIIAEQTFTTTNNYKDTFNKEKMINKTISDLKSTGLIDNNKVCSSDLNFEPYVYPVQSTANKLLLKECNSFLSNFKNLELIGTAANFAYNDMQVIFKQSDELANDISKELQNIKSLSRTSFLSEYVKNDFDTEDKFKLDSPQSFELIAEIGINHNGDIERLENLILKSSKLADVVKLQYYKTDKRIGRRVRELNHIEKAQDIEEDMSQLLNRCEIDLITLQKSINTIKSLGRIPMCTAFDLDGLKELINLELTHIKIASMDLNNYEIHHFITNFDKSLNIYISTGMSTLKEIKDVINLYKNSIHKVTFLLCNSSYPSPSKSLNLAGIIKLNNLSQENIKVGYSDHSIGNEACLAALAMGAKSLEVHFTDNKNISGPDQLLSKDFEDLKFIKDKGTKILESIGSCKVGIDPSEYETWRTQKKSLHASRDIKKGEILNIKNTIAISPPEGISPLLLIQNKLIVKKDILKDKPIKNEDINIEI